jgi:hypothetical protein
MMSTTATQASFERVLSATGSVETPSHDVAEALAQRDGLVVERIRREGLGSEGAAVGAAGSGRR